MRSSQTEQRCPSDTALASRNSSVVLILGVGAGSQAFIEELLTKGVKVVALDQAPQLTPEFLASPLARNLTLLTHDFSDYTGGFFVRLVRSYSQSAHTVKDPSVYRL